MTPRAVLASWPKAAFSAKTPADALKSLLGSSSTEEDSGVRIRAPDIAENGAVVPVTVVTQIKAEAIYLVSSGNSTPLVAVFELNDKAQANISTRIKMGKTGDVVAIVRSGGKLYSNKKAVKVTIGGCGG